MLTVRLGLASGGGPIWMDAGECWPDRYRGARGRIRHSSSSRQAKGHASCERRWPLAASIQLVEGVSAEALVPFDQLEEASYVQRLAADRTW
jgi:hypothetical protein